MSRITFKELHHDTYGCQLCFIKEASGYTHRAVWQGSDNLYYCQSCKEKEIKLAEQVEDEIILRREREEARKHEENFMAELKKI